MKRSVFWGLVLSLVGVLLLLDNLGYLAFLGVSAGQIIWPSVLIGLGVWFLVSNRFSSSTETRELSINRDGAEEADIRLDYGAGEVSVRAGSDDTRLLNGLFEGGVQERVERDGSTTRLWLHSPSTTVVWPWYWGPGMRRSWQVQLSRRVPLDLAIKTGASDCKLDLTDLQIRHLNIDAGASSVQVRLPAQAGYTEVTGSSGVASLSLRVPDGVAARIRTGGGLSSASVDRKRFPRVGGVFESPNFETALNRVDIRLQIGVGSIEIR